MSISTTQHSFNSIKVRLELSIFLMLHCIIAMFLKDKGTIRTGNRLSTNVSGLRFNSIKVRLELFFKHVYISCVKEFQFHKGTIRTGKWALGVCPETEFQFHKGTIRTFEKWSFFGFAGVSIP